MKPVHHAGCNVVYRGPTPEIGDLHCMRDQLGLIRVVYELDDTERELIAKGGRVMLGIFTEPIPPVSMQVIDEGMCQPIAEHGWKVDDNTPWPAAGPVPASDEADRYLEVTEAAKRVATVAALALIQANGDGEQAQKRLEQMRGVDLGNFDGDVITNAQQSITAAEELNA